MRRAEERERQSRAAQVSAGSDLAACTIVPKSRLAYARVLAESFRRHHPTGAVFVLLADRIDGCFSPGQEPFELIELGALGIPDLPRFCFQYSCRELGRAARPVFLRRLLLRPGISKLLYLDPDILIVRELAEVRDLLDTHSILLTPEVTADLEEGERTPGEGEVLESGLYDLGFVGLRSDPTAERFLDRWGARVCGTHTADPRWDLFAEQQWIGLVPGLFDGVHILRQPGYNAAYWNRSRRPVESQREGILVDGQPLRMLRVSGFEPERSEAITTHQARFSPEDFPELGALLEDYREQLAVAGHAESRVWPYAFGSFDNGVPIPPRVRRIYRSLGDGGARFGDPFATARRGSFWSWINAETHPGSGISRLWYDIYLDRPDLRRHFPDVLGKDGDAFLGWCRHHGCGAEGLSEAFRPPGATAPTRQATSAPNGAAAPVLPGLNVAGYATSEKGVGEALRATVRALGAVDIPYCVVDFPDSGSASADRTLIGTLQHNPYVVNLIHVNAESLPHFVDTLGVEFLRGKYNIGFWMWELPEFPAVFQGAFAYLDEVWVGSNYCLDAVSRVSPVPVVKIPLALPEDGLATWDVGREYFGLPDGAQIFLFVFDVHSVIERKNPSGLIRAFKRAFGGEEDVRLVLKLVHGDRRTRQALRDEAGDPRVVVIDRVFERAELNSLIKASDCYVSLHRSEGFGLTMAEAMALEKPVIATAYSANLDFMTPGNSFLVRCDMVRLDRDYGPYPRGSVWAEPDLAHAAEALRLVYEKPDSAREVGRRGSADVWRYLGARTVGERIIRRLEVIKERLEARGPTSAFGG